MNITTGYPIIRDADGLRKAIKLIANTLLYAENVAAITLKIDDDTSMVFGNNASVKSEAEKLNI